VTAPLPTPQIPAGTLGTRGPSQWTCDSPGKPHLNVIRFLQAKFKFTITQDNEDPLIRWTIIWYRDDFYVWDQTHWRVVAETTLRAMVYEMFKDAVYVHIPRAANAVPEYKDFDPDPGKMNALMQGIKDEVTLDQNVNMPVWFETGKNVVMSPQPVSPFEMIACQNGLLYTRSRALWGHTPRFLNDFAVGYEYEVGANPPQEWLNFLKSIWPEDLESIDTLQEMFGYLLTQRNDQQKMFFLYGAKRGGKGTIIRVLEALMGSENVTGTSISNLNSSDHATATLVGKQLAVMSDVRFRSRDDGTAVELLLKITGNDAVLINEKYKKPFTTHLTTRFLMASNELPKMADESGALKGRLILLRFKESFYGREDLDLERRLLLELPGILNWALDGLDRLNARGHFVQPQSGTSELETIEELGSPSIAFVNECCITAHAGLVNYDALWGVWRRWCQDNGVVPGNKITFGKALRAAVPGIDVVKRGPRGKQERHWEGLDLSDVGHQYLAEQSMMDGLMGRTRGVTGDAGDDGRGSGQSGF
jgi:putative DNA primase/helicase